MKTMIESLMENQMYEQAWETILKYEEVYPGDPDVDVYKCMCALGIEEYEAAFWCAKSVVKKMPYSADAHYNYASVCAMLKKWYEAYEQYGIALELAKGRGEHHFDAEQILGIMAKLEKIIFDLEGNNEEKQTKEDVTWQEYLKIKKELSWEVPFNVFHSNRRVIGEEYMDYSSLSKFYIGAGNEKSGWNCQMDRIINNALDSCLEMQRVSEEESVIEIISDVEGYVPIISKERNIVVFRNEEKEVHIPSNDILQFTNYRIPAGKTTVIGKEKFRYGEFVPIGHSEKRKKLVLNIFVDGLSQMVLGENMQQYMPYTYQFFGKGMICTNAYTTGDWTYPAIASIVTGQSSAKHKMLHPILLRKLDIDTKLLFEYFREQGYNTTKIGGNWRITPNYGYARGMNRVLYQHMQVGYTAEQVVSDVQEQMHQMRDTDQFIWMEIGELHLIADELNYRIHASEFPVFENAVTLGKENSVKQEYNETKIKYYLKQVELVDRKLAALYQYIEDNYKDDEILISLFSDHGQSYLIKPEKEFFSDGRSNVAFMFRGNGIKGQTDEVISVCDYTPIMCQMAGIPFDYNNTDANLPKVFGGEVERVVAVSESIHPKDPYRISLKGKDFEFYLNGVAPVTEECRVPLKEYNTKLLDKDGNEISDEEMNESCTKYCLQHIAPCMLY